MCLAGFGNSVLLGLEEGEHRIESVPGDYLGDGGGGYLLLGCTQLYQFHDPTQSRTYMKADPMPNL